MSEQFGYGMGFYKTVSDDLKSILPDVKSFSPTNLKYMRYFYEMYPDAVICPQVEDELITDANRPQVGDDLQIIFRIPWLMFTVALVLILIWRFKCGGKKENINIYGEGYIEDILGEYVFKISPLSFYQVNPIQAEKLYNIGVEAAKITKNDIIFDLYCGIGTISLFMAKYAKKVYGVEIVEQAIVDAKENAKINGIDNTEFIVGDTEKILDELINARKIVPDAIMVDPPRRGLDNTSIDNILKIKPSRLIYISCNPATLVRDLAKFEEVYDVRKIKPVDMFPFTSHVECVAVLQLKQDM